MNADKTAALVDSIARTLRINGAQSSQELQTFSELSQPQLSRYLKLLGSRVLKIGRGKNTRYIHTREIPQVGSEIPIFRVDQRGTLQQSGKLYAVAPRGFYWASNDKNKSRMFDDLPYFLNDLRPAGFLGRLIPRSYPEWQFPVDIRLWNAESTLCYLTHFGIDLVGDLIVGEMAAQKFLQLTLQRDAKNSGRAEEDRYQELAQATELHGLPASSAGGEHPKFVTRRAADGVAVIVKFVAKSTSEVTQRRIDLLRAEHAASELLSTDRFPTSTRIIESSEYISLEVTRFDRTKGFGRRGIISLLSLDAEFVGSGGSWATVAKKLHALKLLDASTVQEIEFREYFGLMIGNSDMHGGNLSFFFEEEKITGLTPVYDMLPMKYAPLQERISREAITLLAPRPASIPVWERAREMAARYWQNIQVAQGFSSDFIEIAKLNEEVLTRISGDIRHFDEPKEQN